MPRILIAVKRFGRREDGVSIAEYALLFLLIAVVCIGAMTALGSKISTFLNSASSTI